MSSSFLIIIIIFIIIIPSNYTFISSSPTISPYQELSPEIAPLLPSPGDSLPYGDGAGTIPSSPSPPDPHTDSDGYPDPVAFAPFASPPVSSLSPPPPPPPPPSLPLAGVLFLSFVVAL
ncbi:unnamed protein product [Cochlearia groenlandica]